MDLRPPTFDDDYDTRVGGLLFWGLWACLGVGVPYLVFANMARLGDVDSANAGVAIGAFAVALVLLYRRRLRSAGGVAVAGLMAANVLEAARLGGPSHFPPLLPDAMLAIALAAAVLRWREVLAVIGANLLLLSALAVAEVEGWLPPAQGALPPARQGAYTVAMLLVSGGFLAVGGRLFRGTIRELQRSEARFRDLVDQLPDGVVTHDAEGTVLSCNPAAARILGRPVEQMVGKHFSAIARIDDGLDAVDGFQALVRGEIPQLPVIRITRRDGTQAMIEPNAVRVEAGERPEVRVVVRDVSERVRAEVHRKELQQQLVEARRLESVGRLAGGVAHDFNNLLTVILTSVDLLRPQPLDEDGRDLLEDVDQAAVRAAELTGQLLAFARRQVREPRVLDLSTVLVEVRPLLDRLVREDIELQVVPVGSPRVFADPLQLEQVLVNLVVNARDAMPDGGRLTVETAEVELTDDYALERAGVQPGRYALLAVSDTGSGMDTETMSQVFDPFFTTKGEAGTGLGLATVHGVVKQSGGHVFVYSEVGRGTTFKVYLPLTDRGVDEPEATPAPGPQAVGRATILVVDDDPAVLATLVRSLERDGFVVLGASSASEAIALSQQHRGRIDLLITDVVMPRMGGVELAEKLGIGRPGLKVLYTSGYTENAIVHHGVLDDGIAFLAKPFTPRVLRDKVELVLAGPT